MKHKPIEVVASLLVRMGAVAAAQERGEIPADAYNPPTWLARDRMGWEAFRASERSAYPSLDETCHRAAWQRMSSAQRECYRAAADALCEYLVNAYAAEGL